MIEFRPEPSTVPLAPYLEAARSEIETYLEAVLPGPQTAPQRLHQAMRWAVLGGGKRVRGVLVLMAGELWGAPREHLLPASAALEMIHAFSLVHDDLPALDDDDLRRGRPTVHRQFDEALAVLAGDALLNLGLGHLADEPRGIEGDRRARAVALAARAIGSPGMIAGQVEDLEAEAAWPEDPRATLERIHRQKTGALIRLSVELGALAAYGPLAGDHPLCRLGEQIGLLFQVVDDLLDVEGDSKRLGKTAGKDVAASKLTYPALYGLEEARAMRERLVGSCRELADRLPGGGWRFVELVDFIARRDH